MIVRSMIATAVAAATLAAGAVGVGTAAAATPSLGTAGAQCPLLFTFNHVSYVYLHANAKSTRMGIAYVGYVFESEGPKSGAFLYGEVGQTRKWGWVRYANLDRSGGC